MLASYVVPYVGLNGYKGSNRFLRGYISKDLLAGLYGVEAGQDAVIRHYLYERGEQIVHPYNITVTEFTNRISNLRNSLGMCGNKDEGVFVPPILGAEMRTCSNVLSADINSLAYGRTPEEILRIVYGTGNERVPGGFFPEGANGTIAMKYLKHHE
ncbi:Desiccation-related protein PCC13-62 [Heracleum sosnowskyi]|uniref:Desiccation-related protein PCC13-62 n=1 Tax=Heracleum sosnowskyi TaxID=360622 RepID=A0AAD8HNW4_9APIA|nr:Desiccation-related protein PCC13-62 [Heracleum sosnowskyi]